MLVENVIPSAMIDMANNFYIPEDMPVMADKLEIPGRATRPVDFDVYQSNYVPEMDASAQKLKKAQLVLCQMIRSFVPSLAAHMGTTHEGKHVYSIYFTCSTINHTDPRVYDYCKWRAILAKEDDGCFRFTRIDSFGVHNDKCIKHRARFTPPEVAFQELYPLRTRSIMAKILKQIPVDETTITLRRLRHKRLLSGNDRDKLTGIVQHIDAEPRVSNFKLEEVATKDKPNEAYRLLQLLTYLWLLSMTRKKDFAFS